MKVVSYVRVSKQRQSRSGPGLAAQENAVREFAAQHDAKIVGSFVEVESGRDDERPELVKAIAYAKRQRATLIVAKLDRLARSVRFVSTLMESGVEFSAADMQFANRLTLHIMSAVAEDEARRISERTKSGLTAYRARGGVLDAARPECRNRTMKPASGEPCVQGKCCDPISRPTRKGPWGPWGQWESSRGISATHDRRASISKSRAQLLPRPPSPTRIGGNSWRGAIPRSRSQAITQATRGMPYLYHPIGIGVAWTCSGRLRSEKGAGAWVADITRTRQDAYQLRP
ncbi:recombinase family protein [Planctomyces sp. SH-PL14]|uniref:recombinase family protein n=1 Tax=Planctomyces sp. SH-PL14 TaxID=1632864 RepID=UPI00078E3B0B|nr:DNA-invertase hin [Planctomyces sp. SH-PL14]